MKVRGLVLFPGAGSARDQSTLLAIEYAVRPLPTFRFDFPYRRAGRKIPDRTPVLVQCVGDEVRSVADELCCSTADLVIGGRSMGGRMCTLAVADEIDSLPVRGVICISYPLHPPKKPDQLRIEHLSRIHVPSLFVSGTRDEFGSPDELIRELAAISMSPTIEFIEGGRHALKGHDDRVAELVAQWLLALQ
ncbi:MAG: alpha/beta hydrolase family protein [Ilumatobacteraceae bacterium]